VENLLMNKLNVISLFSGCGGADLGILGGFSYLNKKNHFFLVP
jgi:DNA (cytosine-5)-methyltransferase 1